MSTDLPSEPPTETHFDIPTLSNGRYQIQGCIGVGGMAAVFKAYDASLQIDRALKVLKPEFLLGDDIRERFQTEAVAMANLKHPNIVQIYDLGLEGMTLYIVMEYLPYGSAKRYINEHGAMSVGQAVQVCLEIASALQYAHTKGFIHRDVKPDNILLTADGAQLSDFGIAKDTESDSGQTRTRAVMGTLQYMSPEQRLNTKNITVQTDIYALVATLFNLMTIEDTTDLFIQDIREELVEELPSSIQQIIHKGCCRELDKRYKTVAELIVDLEAVRQSEQAGMLQLTPIRTPDMIGPNLERLKRVWDKYTSNARESNDTYTHSLTDDGPTHPWQMQTTEASSPTWNNSPVISPKSKINQELSGDEIPIPDHEHDTMMSLGEAEVSTPSSTSTRAGILVVLLSLFLGFQWNDFALLSLTEQSEGTLVLETEESSATVEFKEAKRLVLDGKLAESAKILSELHKESPTDPVVHNLYTLTMILQGQYTLPPTLFSTSLYSYSHPTASPELREFFQLLSKSWDPNVPRKRLEESWLELIQDTNDPLIELNYLVAMRYKMGVDFDGVVERYAMKNNRGVAPYIRVLADIMRTDTGAALEVVQSALRQNPGDLNLTIQRARLLLLAGKTEIAADIIQQTLDSAPMFVPALEQLSILQYENDEQDGYNTTMMKLIGDDVPTVKQVHFLYHAGELYFADGDYKEAYKHWEFCANLAAEYNNNYYVILAQLRAIEAHVMLEPSADWLSTIDKVKVLLEGTVLHFTERKRFNVYLQYLIGLNALNVGDTSTVESVLTEMETLGTASTFGIQLPGLQELKATM